MKINKKSLTTYTDNLLAECNLYLTDSDFIKDKFIKLNTYLLSKSGKRDMLITLKVRKELTGLLRSVLYYAKSQYKLQPVSMTLPQVGSLVYHDKKVFKITNLEEDQALITDRADSRNKRTQPVTFLRKIENTTFVRRRRKIDFADDKVAILADNAEAYYEWLAILQKQFLNEPAQVQDELSDDGKILIITSNEREIDKILSELHVIPFQHCKNNTSASSTSCTSFRPLADVYTSMNYLILRTFALIIIRKL